MARRRGIRVFISGLSRQPLEALKKSGLYSEMGPGSFFPDQASAVEAACRLVRGLHQEEGDDDEPGCPVPDPTARPEIAAASE